MSWKHAGKHQAFNYDAFTEETAISHQISCELITLKTSRIYITEQALAMLASLNDFDQRQVVKEMDYVCKNPNSCSSVKHSNMPFKRLWRSKDQFRSYHYLLEFKVNANGLVVIQEIYFDENLQGKQSKPSHERNMMYTVKRTGDRFNGVFDEEQLKKTSTSWTKGVPTQQINTQHAAVNGMQNPLTKASWLMGTHLDVAYPKDDFKVYTLFHNPTDSVFYDVVECVFDKRKGTKSQNARHLAAILKQNQQKGQKTKWVVHSQGAIIFSAALEHYRSHHTGGLTCHQVVIHAPGAWLSRLSSIAIKLGVEIIKERSNPFDLVPNIAGTNDLSPSSLVRSLKFFGLTFFGNELTSPHTLPYLGLESYHCQLRLAGNHRRADDVIKYINKIA